MSDDRLRAMMAELADDGPTELDPRLLAVLDRPDVGVDPGFTARVLSSLPAAPLGQGMSPRLRLAVVGSAYLVAAVAGWLALQGQGELLTQWTQTAHGVLADIDGSLGVGASLGLGALVLAVVAFAWRTTHTTAA